MHTIIEPVKDYVTVYLDDEAETGYQKNPVYFFVMDANDEGISGLWPIDSWGINDYSIDRPGSDRNYVGVFLATEEERIDQAVKEKLYIRKSAENGSNHIQNL